MSGFMRKFEKGVKAVKYIKCEICKKHIQVKNLNQKRCADCGYVNRSKKKVVA